ncbi:MAG TPA: molybdopterin-dependent oxidoreductase, partial [Syntrophorhabdales bacterium]|nr:molybdopterin-dependent oxidoreductase [Syntrophorhabdales bacterium]
KVFNLYRDMGLSNLYSYDDLKKCDLIIIAGANLLSNNHLLANKVREAFKLNGARIIVVDPSPTAVTRIADAHLAVAPGRDALLFNSFALRLVEERKYAPEAGLVEGFAGFTAMLERWKIGLTEQHSGVAEREFEKAYRLIRDSESVGIIFGSGITSSADALSTLLNFGLLKGVPAKGAMMSVACEANASGAAGILNGSLLAPEELLKSDDMKGFCIYEDDPFHYLNGRFVKERLSDKEFLLVADAMTTSVVDLAHLTVPTGTFAEKSGTFVAQDGYVRTLNKAMRKGPGGFEFLQALLEKLGGTAYKDVHAVTEKMRTEKILESMEPGKEGLACQGSGPKFVSHDMSHELRITAAPDKAYKLILRDVFSNHHLYGKDIYSKGVAMAYTAPGYPVSEDKLFISPEDAQKLGVEEHGHVVIESAEGSVVKAVSIKKGLRQGVLEYVLFKERAAALGLSSRMQEVLDVTVKKG